MFTMVPCASKAIPQMLHPKLTALNRAFYRDKSTDDLAFYKLGTPQKRSFQIERSHLIISEPESGGFVEMNRGEPN